MYLASMPRMGELFAMPASVVQLTLTAYMIGMAVASARLARAQDPA